ncbi:glycosyltransferase [Candidatus Kaiserbacteria bacterium]|nr:glycosyltransferase [Candidatus Kaiserbacteria bacterium]
MRLLIFMQTVDREDTTLGFYHGWIEELAKHFERLLIGALRVGAHDLPKNVTIVSLRPWGYRARVRTALRVLRLTWERRREYDAVFVHMNEEYLLVAGWLFRLLGKRVYFWRNHYAGSILTDIAALFCDKIFYTSKSSYTAKYAHAVQVPVGVDVGSCHLDEPVERRPHSVLFLGRFDISKRPDLVVEALGRIAADTALVATFVGGSSDPASPFPKKVEERAKELGISDKVVFAGPVPNTDTYRFYRSHAVYVNCSRSGMLDKSLFKAIACGCLPLFTSADMAEIIGPEFSCAHDDADDLARQLKKALALSEEERAAFVRAYQKKAIDTQTLPVLGRRLAEEMTL